MWPPHSTALVSGLSSEMLELVIDVAYHVPLHERFGLHNVREVLDVAEALGITKVRDHCLRLLGENLEPENCIGTYRLVSSKECRLLSADAFRYIVRTFDKVWTPNSQFRSLMPDEHRSMLYDDELHAPDELECAFGAILKWIAGNVQRRGHLPRLLPLIRFAFCSRAEIEKVENDPLVRASEEALEVLLVFKRTLSQEPMDDVYWRVRPDLSELRWLKPRDHKDVLFMFGGWTGGATNHLLTCNGGSSRWLIQHNQHAPPRTYHGVSMLDGLIYFMGGFDGHDCYHTAVCLDVSKLKCTTRSNMQEARCCVSVAVLQGYIYAIGGFDGDGPTSSCKRYTPSSTSGSSSRPCMQSHADHACAAAAAARIYVMGGFTGLKVLDTVECYDPSADAWSYVPNMSSPRSGLKAVVHDDMIYVVGGFDGNQRLESAERLDTRRGRWSELPSMTFQRRNFVSVLLDGSIYVAGGFDGATTISLVERYDINARQWHRAQDLSITCSAAAACVYQDIPDARRWV